MFYSSPTPKKMTHHSEVSGPTLVCKCCRGGGHATSDCLHFQMTWSNLEVDPSERIDGVWSNLFDTSDLDFFSSATNSSHPLLGYEGPFDTSNWASSSFESRDHQEGTEVACERVIKDGASNMWKSSNPTSESPLVKETAISLGSTYKDGFSSRKQEQNFVNCINNHLNPSNQINASALNSEKPNAFFGKSDNFSQETDKYPVFSPASPKGPLRFEDETEFNMKVDCDKIACTDISPPSPRSE